VSGKIILQVADSQCEWNHRAFAITLESGHVKAAPTLDAPGISLDIQALTQAFWGQPSLDLLRAAGRLSVTNEADYQLLSRLLPPSICYLGDHF
jgi:predicted acetyltransferase